MHTKPAKPLRPAGRDNIFPMVYNFTSLRFQVDDISRRLGERTSRGRHARRWFLGGSLFNATISITELGENS